MKKKKRVQFAIEEDLYKRLKKKIVDRDTTWQEVLTSLVTEWEDSSTSELRDALIWIIHRIEGEADKKLGGGVLNWKKAAEEAVEEAYGALNRDGYKKGKS